MVSQYTYIEIHVNILSHRKQKLQKILYIKSHSLQITTNKKNITPLPRYFP